MERVSDETKRENECYQPQKAVITEAAQSTKMRFVLDALGEAN